MVSSDRRRIGVFTRPPCAVKRSVGVILVACSVVGLSLPASAYKRPLETEIVSLSDSGQPADGPSGAGLSMSPDGRFVAFSSEASNLDGRDGNRAPDVFVRDRARGRTEVVSVTSAGLLGDAKDLAAGLGSSQDPRITPSGRFVAFSSSFPLADEDLDIFSDVYVHDRHLKRTELISADEVARTGFRPAISANGRYVAYEGGTTFLGAATILLHDRRAGETRVVAENLDGDPVAASASSISANGRFVVFTSSAGEIVASPVPAVGNHVYVRDMKTGETELVSKNVDGQPANSPATRGSVTDFGTDHISSDGRYVLFSSHAEGIVPNDGRTIFNVPEIVDIFVMDRKTDRMHRVTVDSSGQDMFGNLQHPSLSPDGRYIVFKMDSTDAALVRQGCPDDCHGVYLHDLRTGVTEAVGPTHNSQVDRPVVAGRGRFVAFTGTSDVWHDADRNEHADVLLHDRGASLSVGRLVADGKARSLTMAGAAAFATTGTTSMLDALGDTSVPGFDRNADLMGARITYRPELDDLFVTLELNGMDASPILAATTAALLYGLSFSIGDRSYQLRAASTGIGPHGQTMADLALYECTAAKIFCQRKARLHGGFGTTGPRVHFSVPLARLDLGRRSVISDARAFTAIGAMTPGPIELLDHVRIR